MELPLPCAQHTLTPVLVFPEMTFPGGVPGGVALPPTVFEADDMSTPVTLPTAVVPVISVPM